MATLDHLGARLQAGIDRIERGATGAPAALLGLALGGAAVVGGIATLLLVWAVLVGLLN